MIERVPTTVMAVRPFPPDKVATIVNLVTSNPFVNGEVVVLDGDRIVTAGVNRYR